MPIMDLGYRFGVGSTTVSKCFIETIHVMFVVLPPLIRWSSRDELSATMPMCFRKYFGEKLTVIIDCFEIFIDRPSNMVARATDVVQLQAPEHFKISHRDNTTRDS